MTSFMASPWKCWSSATISSKSVPYRPSTNRHDADLHDDSTGAAQASDVVLRGAGATNVGECQKRPQIHVRGTFECSSNTERISLNPCFSSIATSPFIIESLNNFLQSTNGCDSNMHSTGAVRGVQRWILIESNIMARGPW